MSTFPYHSRRYILTLIFLIFIVIRPVTGVSFVSNCPDVCTYRGSSNSLICTDVRYPRLPHILHCLNKIPLIREIALETVRFSCNCVWVRFLQLMRSRAIHVLPSRLTVMCFNTPREKCDRVFMKASLPVADGRVRRQATDSATPVSDGRVRRQATDSAAFLPVADGRVRRQATDSAASLPVADGRIRRQATDSATEPETAETDVTGDVTSEEETAQVNPGVSVVEEDDGAEGEEIVMEDGQTDRVGDKADVDIKKQQDDKSTQSYDGSVINGKGGSNATDILVVGFTNTPRLVVLEFGIVTGVICLTAVITLCVWLSYHSNKSEPEPENVLLEVVMHPERYQHSHACLRPKVAPYRLTPLPPDGAEMQVHWVQATVPLGRLPGGITSHYP